MSCQRCKSVRILGATSKSSDCNSFTIAGKEAAYDCYVVPNAGIGRGDYIDLAICLDCGQVQGEFPRPKLVFDADTTREKSEDDILAGSSRIDPE